MQSCFLCTVTFTLQGTFVAQLFTYPNSRHHLYPHKWAQSKRQTEQSNRTHKTQERERAQVERMRVKRVTNVRSTWCFEAVPSHKRMSPICLSLSLSLTLTVAVNVSFFLTPHHKRCTHQTISDVTCEHIIQKNT